jgi:hypothetical protein
VLCPIWIFSVVPQQYLVTVIPVKFLRDISLIQRGDCDSIIISIFYNVDTDVSLNAIEQGIFKMFIQVVQIIYHFHFVFRYIF